MSSVAGALQAALYARLTNDGPLMAQLTGVFDVVPDQQPLPYVTIGEMLLSDWSTFGIDGQQIAFEVHTWSHAPGRQVAQAIMNRVDTLLHQQPLAMTGYTMVTCQRESEEVLRDPDGLTMHGIQRFRAYVHPA